MALALMQSKLTRLNVDCQLITALVGVDIDDIAAVHLAQAAHSDWVAACIALHAPSTRRESTTPRAVNCFHCRDHRLSVTLLHTVAVWFALLRLLRLSV